MLAFYKTFDDVKAQTFDGMIITGAPVEQMAFEEVEYWSELCEIMEWSKTHVHSTFHICWGRASRVVLSFRHSKTASSKRCSELFSALCRAQTLNAFCEVSTTGLWYLIRATQPLMRAILLRVPSLKFLLVPKKRVYAVSTDGGRQIFITGHSEYDADTLKKEYLRDLAEGKPIEIPKNYFPHDNPNFAPVVSWRGHSNLLYSNWLNYFVYQTTPYDITTIK